MQLQHLCVATSTSSSFSRSKLKNICDSHSAFAAVSRRFIQQIYLTHSAKQREQIHLLPAHDSDFFWEKGHSLTCETFTRNK